MPDPFQPIGDIAHEFAEHMAFKVRVPPGIDLKFFARALKTAFLSGALCHQTLAQAQIRVLREEEHLEQGGIVDPDSETLKRMGQWEEDLRGWAERLHDIEADFKEEGEEGFSE